MKFSELWLREWVNPPISSEVLADQLTMAGLEVESVEPVSGHFTGIVVGQVVECRPHPKNEKLKITKVNIGSTRLLDIICNLSDYRIDIRVAVATPGAFLPGDLIIKTTKLYGELSEGMLCSFSNLGISGEKDGVIELPKDAPIGKNIRDYLKLEDHSINISVTPNRADCLSLLGIAREIAVYNQLPLCFPIIKKILPIINDTILIRIDETEACPRYLARVIKNIDFSTKTPLWIKEKLRRCGMKSTDVVITDITNYVLLELGQPIQTFDRNCIEGGLVVRYARPNEGLTLIDGSAITLLPDTLVIADRKKVLALAGIVGGASSHITPISRDVVLESAFFCPLAIIGRARQYGLHPDLGNRYERGVDPTLQLRAIERATSLLITICGGEPGSIIDVTSKTSIRKPATIMLYRKTLDRIIGHFIPDEDVNNILTRLGCQVNRIEKVGWKTLAPSWRFDIAIEEDLIEEVLRIYGYTAIPNVPVRTDLLMPHHPETLMPLSRVKTLLVDRGYQEVITYSFVDPKSQILLHPQQRALELSSPISKDMSTMRVSLWTALLKVVVYNQNRQQQRIRIFESGFRFIPDKTVNLGIRQDLMLGGVIAGLQFDEHWSQTRRIVDFYDAKGDLEAILELTGKLNDIEFRAQQHPALHPGQSAEIYLKNEAIGFIGVIHPELGAKLNLNGRSVVFELLWEKINDYKVTETSHISRFPANRRDIAVVVSDDIPSAEIIAQCKKIAKGQLVNINLFDVYRGSNVAKGFKSLAISLILQDTARTLEEEEIAATVAKCVAGLKQRFQASLRD
ncbi:phenylalanine--tRNA ligase subunit beta [Candidatus Steffania adelgidicola]|uniref:phenylalanine--tRNA ligase subunit beta n=1 Tax=Candidatus Steffania adelgidicola TaxID=1076626 RepID=UPI001D006032|nr:phenylalanine--tRNA ligase subunit beta [Candidatus Steffania adelgidicola]UDG79588.1 Phenylalanine--tRNA ligase beta subunit [Candidatus Steffania adelgidicola]